MITEKHRISMRNYQQTHKVQLREYMRKYREAHREKILEYMRDYNRRWYQAHKTEKLAQGKRLRQRLKLKALAHYSLRELPKCVKCGITDVDVLCIDHINGGGSAHRRQLAQNKSEFYRWLMNNNYPAGYQTLCANCNLKKRIVSG